MQSAKPDRQTYYYHLNGLKGMACLLVMIDHYLGIYKYALSFESHIQLLDRLKYSFLTDEGYWLYLFFVVSGYLVSKSKVTNIKELISKSVNRFLRLALPVLFSCFMIYLIEITVGFHAAETDRFFQCAWYQQAYTDPCTLVDVLLSPFYVLFWGDFRLNAPYWVLQMMFYSSLLIYLINFLCVKLKATEHEGITFSALIIITVLSYGVSPIITACLVGMLISWYENSTVRTTASYAFWIIVAAMLLHRLPKTIDTIIFFAALIVFVPQLKLLNRFFSSKPMQYIGSISWGIYSFHWPIICSIGALSIIMLSDRTGVKEAYLVTFLVVVILTFLLSACFYYTLERLADRIAKRVNCRLQRLMKIDENASD